ncbi:hypothetical protein NP233_g7762 [Leucocoprinus birnbaumii]|uniref:Uncharacterized protein n=1 Tax=Leucocoprinus birnbaumii TaxID=56174 RepID=A0AAD5YSG3_9AGAR|nr:hypothetical protein NP233_g7762 [Leucocoprinus birnbaumii]
MKWASASVLASMAFLMLGSKAQVDDDLDNDQGGRLVVPWEGGGTTANAIWSIEEVGDGQYTIFSGSAGYAIPVTVSVEIIEIVTSTSVKPTHWTIQPVSFPGAPPGLYTISAPVSPVPNTQIMWWTLHDATNLLFADLTNDPADSFANRLWFIV